MLGNKAYCGVNVRLISAINRGKLSASRSGCFTPLPTEYIAVWAPERVLMVGAVWRRDRSLAPARNRTTIYRLSSPRPGHAVTQLVGW